MTTVGQTITGNVVITGQFDVDNISISGNGIIATNSGGGININPNATGQVTIGGTVVQVPRCCCHDQLELDEQSIPWRVQMHQLFQMQILMI